MRKLSTKITLHLLLVLVIAGVASVAIFSTGWRSAYRHGFAMKFAAHAASLVGERIDDQVRRRRVIDRISDDLDLFITLRDDQGAVIYAAGPPLPTVLPGDPRLRNGPTFIRGDRDFPWFTAAPVVDTSGRTRGVLLGAPMHRFREPFIPWRPFAWVAAMLTIVALAVRPLARRITRPVEALTDGSRRLAAGDLSHRVKVPRRWRPQRHADQLDELIRTWNEMAERVESLVRGHKELLANVSHELRSPLARLRVAMELLPREGGSQQRLADMESDVAELDALIETLLTSARLEATGLPARIGAVDVQALFDEVKGRAARDPRLASAQVVVDEVDPEVRTVQGDGELLLRALWNLVENAGRHGAPPITLRARRAPTTIEISVSDEGAGIPPAELERVFAPFYRLPGAHKGGFGLGLTLVKRVAEAHGGSARVEADERGCRVTLALPLDKLTS
jgi:signal transduction histidine kinase